MFVVAQQSAPVAGQERDYVEIMRSLRTTTPTISRRKRRFEQDGIAGLDPRRKGSQPRLINIPQAEKRSDSRRVFSRMTIL